MKNKLPSDRLLVERLRAAEARHPFVPPNHANPAQFLNQFGENLVNLIGLHQKQMENFRQLYLLYLIACDTRNLPARPYGNWGAQPEAEPR